jgi:hypothetical protein
LTYIAYTNLNRLIKGLTAEIRKWKKQNLLVTYEQRNWRITGMDYHGLKGWRYFLCVTADQPARLTAEYEKKKCTAIPQYHKTIFSDQFFPVVSHVKDSTTHKYMQRRTSVVKCIIHWKIRVKRV